MSKYADKFVSGHAVDRGRQRVPEWSGLSEKKIRSNIYRKITEEGRELHFGVFSGQLVNGTDRRDPRVGIAFDVGDSEYAAIVSEETGIVITILRERD